LENVSVPEGVRSIEGGMNFDSGAEDMELF